MASKGGFMPVNTDDDDDELEKPWNIFEDPPREPKVGSAVKQTVLDNGVIVLKFFTIFVVFCVVLGGSIVSKGTLLFMTSQIRKNITRPYCNNDLAKNLQFNVTLPVEERVTWIWYLMFAYFVPEFGTFFRSVRKCLFKTWQMPKLSDALTLFITELAPAIGSAILIFIVLPELDVVKGAMLTNAVCFIPCVVGLFSRDPFKPRDSFKMALDILSLIAQATSFVIWPLLEDNRTLYMIPVAVVLISLGWWENFVVKESKLGFISKIAANKQEFKNDLYILYAFIAPLKCLAFFCTTLVIFQVREDDVSFLFDNFYSSFQDRQIWVTEIEPVIRETISDISETVATGKGSFIDISYLTPIWVWLINISATYTAYAFGKFSCKVMFQELGFAFPINISVPVLLSGLIAMCGMFTRDECSFDGAIPKYLFFNSPPLYYLNDFISQQHAYVWLVWLLSQAWITIHIWSPNCDKLSTTEALFMKPMYDAFLIDQSLAMTRRRDESPKRVVEDKGPVDILLNKEEQDPNRITRIYACGTMWHETREEMLEFLKSIMRLDTDQSAHSLVRNEFKVHLNNYYELETHVFFDDSFVRRTKDGEPYINEYVQFLVSCMDEAASKVHKTDLQLPPPIKYATPYGGRLVWTLPGGTPFIVHLKDKKKIRAKKRWSQVMYMYYLLGHRLVCNDELTPDEIDLRAENTYLLALDGDIDFQPEALHLLVDYMKKNKTLGAACGRIHPVGSGGMAWYQMFEYAVGHWLQKATEHVIGCVLCSPGCFSLFRGKALMDKSVMKKYTTRATEAKHFVQYDQGEDRWLCTLLLQRGYRVEYSAASDAFTHCPEGFNEFYNQRRRWMPSTMANIIDLLADSESTVKVNDNISRLYIFYQVILLVGTAIGPGSIFLMLVGAFVAAFGLNEWNSFYWNLAPILIFIVVCATCNADIQLFFAGIISAIYGLVMMAVLVGVMLQISEDGFLAPSSLFFFCMGGEFIIAAILHPKEFNCLKYGIVYYVTVPSMYMLLVIYSVFNMNNVSWGTRDVTVAPPPDEKEKKEEAEKEEEKKPEKKKDKIFSFLGADTSDNEGSFEFAFNKLFKCMFCTYRGQKEEDEQLKIIKDQLLALNKKLDGLEQKHLPEIPRTPKSAIGSGTVKSPNNVKFDFSKNEEKVTDNTSISSEEVLETGWLYTQCIEKGEVRFLDQKEKTFWNELLEEYLEPIEDNKKKVSADLKDLRDRMVFTFFMLNSLYVLVIFLLTLKKDLLHLNWPFNPKINFTYVPDTNEVHLYKDYLQLEPIGFVFLIFFALLLVIQFFGMIVHRFGTFSQILANTRIDINLCGSGGSKSKDKNDLTSNPLRMAYALQDLQGINDDNDEEEMSRPVSNRKTVSNLIENRPRKSERIFSLKSAFEKRANETDVEKENDFRKKSIAVIQQRRKTIKRMSQASSTHPYSTILPTPRPSINQDYQDIQGEQNYDIENETSDVEA